MILVNIKHSDDNYKESGNYKLKRLPRVEAATLRSSIEAALKNSTRGEKYIKDLIERVAVNTKSEVVSTDMLRLFDLVYESRASNPLYGGIWIILNGSIGSFAVNYWTWVGGKGSAELLLGPPIIGDFEIFHKLSPQEQQIARQENLINFIQSPLKGGMTTIHELMHVAVKGRVPIENTTRTAGNDFDYADAVADLAGEKRPVYIPAEAVLYPKPALYRIPSLPSHILVSNQKNTAASSYWGQRLNQACKYPSHITNKPTNFKLYKEETK